MITAVIQLMKYSLRSLLLVTLVAGFAAAYIARNLPSKTPISQITTSKEWYAKAGPKSNVLLIVDNSFHNETKYEFERYDSICKNFRWRYRQDPILFMDPMKNSELWGIVENLWRNHELNSDFHFGYKGYGGRGVVAWIRDGELVDFELLRHVGTIEQFEKRCDTAFKR